jgi:biopolymer transport protein TolQ
MQFTLAAATDENLWELITRTVGESGTIEKAVFFLLAAFSIISWCVVVLKVYDLYHARRSSERFLLLFDSAENFGEVLTAAHSVGRSPALTIFKAALTTLENRSAMTSAGAVNDARQIQLKPGSTPEEMMLLDMQDAAQFEYSRLQRGLGFLATIGATTPFIGLFGTVWGIMDTFRALGGSDNASLKVVGPGISSALIATAAGLAVAIPAVMAYNWLLGQIEEMQDNGDSFIERMRVLVIASGFLKRHEHSPSSVAVRAPKPHAHTENVVAAEKGNGA